MTTQLNQTSEPTRQPPRGQTSHSTNGLGPVSEPPPRPAPARQELIAETAYFRAVRRGFAPGGELVDWLEAEREVDHQTAQPSHC